MLVGIGGMNFEDDCSCVIALGCLPTRYYEKKVMTLEFGCVRCHISVLLYTSKLSGYLLRNPRLLEHSLNL